MFGLDDPVLCALGNPAPKDDPEGNAVVCLLMKHYKGLGINNIKVNHEIAFVLLYFLPQQI